MMMRLLSFVLLLGATLAAGAQYPQGYFRNPLGIPMQLVANFGEVRTDHFHMGFDLRTNQRENMPVYAAAEGWVSRVIVEPGGYGRCIMISHPNGYTTLYAHLNGFYPALQRHLEEKQYREEKWEQEITFKQGEFPVSKGQFIAYSGSTGASEGPHLHFEVRETKTGNNINPRLFGFPIKDVIAPLIYRLFLYDRNYSTYAIDPSAVSIRKTPKHYITRDTIVYTGSPKISFGISSEDIGNTSSFRYGIYAAEIWVDSVKQFGFTLDKLNYEASRFVNAAIDYKKRLTDRSLVQHLSRLPGNHMNIYDGLNDGVVELKDTIPHEVVIRVSDVNGNHSDLRFRLAWDPARYEQRFFTQETEPLHPNKAHDFRRDNIEIHFPATAIYDTVAFFHSEVKTGDNDLPMHQLHHHYVPLHDPYTVTVKPETAVADPSRIIWRMGSPRGAFTVKAKYDNGSFKGRFDKFGMLSLLYDTVAPRLIPVGWKSGALFGKSGSMLFLVKDDHSSVTAFRAELDGNWLMFSRKGNYFTYRFDERCGIGMHELKVTIRDIAGNETVETYQFELKEKLPVKKKAVKKKRKRR